MSYLMTWALRIPSPSIIAVPYSLGLSIHMPGECMGREQSHIGIIIRPNKKGRISIPFVFPTCVIHQESDADIKNRNGIPHNSDGISVQKKTHE